MRSGHNMTYSLPLPPPVDYVSRPSLNAYLQSLDHPDLMDCMLVCTQPPLPRSLSLALSLTLSLPHSLSSSSFLLHLIFPDDVIINICLIPVLLESQNEKS